MHRHTYIHSKSRAAQIHTGLHNSCIHAPSKSIDLVIIVPAFIKPKTTIIVT